MAKRLARIFRFRNLLVFCSVLAILALTLAYLTPFVHPRTFSFLPFFGLSYWIIILINIALLAIWSFMRSRWALVLLFFILVGGKLHFRTFSFGWNDTNTSTTELHVMSYNVRLFDLYNTKNGENYKTRNNILKYIQERNPDVACFQEFYHQDPPTNFVTKDTLVDLMNFVDYHEQYVHRSYFRMNFGIVVFSKFPIVEKGIINFSKIGKSFNYCIYTDIVKELDTFRVYNVHLQSIHFQKDDYALFDDEEQDAGKISSDVYKLLRKVRDAYPIRADQAKLVAEHIVNSPHPVIVCGDFNDTPLSYSYNQFNKLLIDGYRNTSFGIGKTYAGNIPAGRIDYIFHSPSLGSKEFVIQNEKLSDHYAIDCKLFRKEAE